MAPTELTLTAVATAVACAVPGVFLVLRRMTLTGDAISHVILLGIVAGFLLGGRLDSPWVVIGATGVGVLAVAMVEWLERTRLVRGDAALGLVYPALFSFGVILVSRSPAGSIHLDVDAVLLGELAQAPLRRFEAFGRDFGPWSFVVMTGVGLLNVAFVALFYKELKLTTFDPDHAATLGFRPARVHYALMTLVSLTVVAAFDAAGSVLVVAFLVAPAAAAYLFTDRLAVMLLLAAVVAALGAAAGTEVAARADANIAGSVAAVLGGIFILALLFAPRHGLAAGVLRRARLRSEFERGLLVVHLAHHENTPAAAEENRADRLATHLNWPEAKVVRVLSSAERLGLARQDGPLVAVTDAGRRRAELLFGG